MIKLQTYDKQYLTKVSTNLTFQQNIFIISQETILHKLNLDIVGRYSSQCAACIEVHIHCPLNITQHITIIVQITGNKNEYTLCEHLHLADTFIQSDLQCIQAILFFVSMCVPWELNPQTFARC